MDGHSPSNTGAIGIGGFSGLSLVGLLLVGNVGIFGLGGIIGIGGFGGFSLISLVDFDSLIGCIDPISLADLSGINGLIGQNNLINHNGPFDHIGLVCRISQSSLVRLIGHSGLVSNIGLSLVSLVRLIGLSFVSLIRLIGHISLVGLGGFNDISVYSLISLVGLIGLTGLVSLIGLSNFGKTSLISSSALSAHRLIGLVIISFVIHHLVAFVNMTKTKTWWLMDAKTHVTHRVATVQSSTIEIVNATISYYHATSLLHTCSFVRKKMCWWLAPAKKEMWLWIASFDNPYHSYHNDALQFTNYF